MTGKEQRQTLPNFIYLEKAKQTMEIEHKKTTLEDNAAIYQKGEEREESKSTKQKWKELDTKGKWSFFVDYYLFKLILIVAAAALLGSLLYTTLKPRPDEQLYVIMLDNILDLEGTEDYFEKAIEGIGYDPDKNRIMLNDSLSSQSASDLSNISTYAFAGTLDVLIAPETALQNYAKSSLLAPLEELPADILAAIPEEDRFYYTNEKTGELHFYGVRLDDTEFYKTLNKQGYDRSYTFSITQTGEYMDNAVKLLRYMLGLPATEE